MMRASGSWEGWVDRLFECENTLIHRGKILIDHQDADLAHVLEVLEQVGGLGAMLVHQRRGHVRAPRHIRDVLWLVVWEEAS